MSELTQLITRARDGDSEASAELFRAVYADLRQIAGRQVGRGDADGIGRTSLVHEAYLRLAKPQALALSDREHFFAVAARVMRQVAVDHVRARLAAKRGGGAESTGLDASIAAPDDGPDQDQLLALNAALDELECAEKRLARLVELRFFGGMTLEEAGGALGLSPRTLKRDWRKARAFLHARLGEGGNALESDR
jgi:RNA polymerase sigma factor (TIGR02999 family)